MGRDIMVKKLEHGQGEIASYGAIVKCNLKSYLIGEEHPFEILEGQRFKIGEGDAIPGLELPLRHSRVGDKFIVKSTTKFAYGYTGRPAIKPSSLSTFLPSTHPPITDDIPAIPPNADLEFHVEVTEHIDEDSLPAGSRERTLLTLALRKECGNRYWYLL